MRAAVRPILLFVLLVGYTSIARTDGTGASAVADPSNYVGFAKGSPAPMTGGVSVTVDQKADIAYTCTKIVIYVIDTTTGDTVGMVTFDNPGDSVNKTFPNLGSNRPLKVAVEATFETGSGIDSKSVNANVTTQ